MAKNKTKTSPAKAETASPSTALSVATPARETIQLPADKRDVPDAVVSSILYLLEKEHRREKVNGRPARAERIRGMMHVLGGKTSKEKEEAAEAIRLQKLSQLSLVESDPADDAI
jgi:hypothetical protein